ncbi:MAG: choice-of-anchor L domain-containing protein [Flavobacteriales bacterium]|nr:choice-of-anchor L domain-containing protein [Flavobacteriales bacterium]MCB9193955.1 choice-of-anchor L domain-containing protein [Flavobacteriales bacterium]
MHRSFLVAFFCPLVVQGQYTYDNSLPIDHMVQQVLAGPGVVVSNVTITPDTTDQYAVFGAPNTCLQMSSGLLLTTGSLDVAGPNAALCWSAETQPFGPSDPDMDQLLGGVTRDQVTLDMDVMPLGDPLLLRYRFGSEEFGPMVPVNDGMGIFLSGPGINGPYANGAENVAVLPGTSAPVSTDALITTADSAYFVNNGDGLTAPYNADPYYIQYDGLSTLLQVAWPVQAGATYHLRIAVADVFDRSCDSGVFLQAGGLQVSFHEGVDAPPLTGPELWCDPEHQVLHIQGAGPAEVIVHALDGRTVKRCPIADRSLGQVPIAALAPGIYLITLGRTGEAPHCAGRIVVER